jgi:ATP-dependent DNA helicase RecQ
MKSSLSILQHYWKHDQFRPMQEEIIQSVLDGKDTLALLPTGGGKSICFQVPALLMDGLCLVISPLIALMQDQVSHLTEKGIPAASLNSCMTYAEVKSILQKAARGDYKFLYVSPERIESTLFKEYLSVLDISLIAVDEAHCISQWGYDFRPPYLRIAALREELDDVTIIALTASATEKVPLLSVAAPTLFSLMNTEAASTAAPPFAVTLPDTRTCAIPAAVIKLVNSSKKAVFSKTGFKSGFIFIFQRL